MRTPSDTPIAERANPAPKKGPRNIKHRWVLGNPQSFFDRFRPAVVRLRPLLPLFIVFLLIGVPIAVFLYSRNVNLFHRDLHRYREGVPYLVVLIVNLLTINLLRCLVQGLVCSAVGVPIPEFGIRLRFGVLPRFFIDKSRVAAHNRSTRLWVYATSPLLRLALIALGLPLWMLFRESAHPVAAVGAWVAHAGFIGLLFVTIPLWQSDGYHWLVAYLNLHPRFRQHSIRTLYHTVRRRPLPKEVPVHRRHHYVAFGTIFAIGWSLLFLKVTGSVMRGLEQSFPTVFGYSSHWLIFCIVATAVGTWLIKRLQATADRSTGD